MVAKQAEVEGSESQSEEFDRAFELLRELVDLSEANERHPKRANAVYTSCVVLWMLIYQRLKPDASLESAVKHLVETQPDYLPDNKRIREGNLSTSTAAYSHARSDLPVEVVQWFAGKVCHGIIDQTPALLRRLRIFLLDGTTITLAPEKELQDAFPPATNQHGEGVWPVALLTVFHELASGCALLPEVGAMYGPGAVSETELARRGIARLPGESLVMTDAGFGIFGVAWEAARYGHDFLLRMKKANFAALRKRATLVSETEDSKTWSLSWTPTRSNRRTQPTLPADAAIEVTLHEAVVSETLTLYLVTSLADDAATLGSLYEHRVQVEFDIRNLKVVLDTENIRGKSVEMFEKELYTSVVAYNLVGQFRREAAAVIDEPPRRMSFKRTWTTFRTFLLGHLHTDAEAWRKAFARALGYATKDKLPRRPGRTAKREAYRKNHKSCHFEKRQKPPAKINHNELK